ncbi:MAG: DUF362 domain-containing protein [candidate division KSB1 bacterium]|nr:DUF362 domain-containing protein [candidate division KSB1 bacterium]
MKRTRYKRREFLKTTVQASSAICFGITGLAPTLCSAAMPSKQSTIVVAENHLVRDSKDKLIGNQVGRLLERAMENLLQVPKSELAWQKLFGARDVVGIKVNCLAGKGISTHFEIVEAIIEGLRSAGVMEKNIIIWDRSSHDLEKAGYRIQTDHNRVQCYGTERVGYTYRVYEFGEVGSCLSKILVEKCTAIINVPILKDHGIVGMTNALKNFFGAIHNPNKYHDQRGDPYIADVNMLSEIRSKVKLIISDALTAQCEGGPPFMPQWAWSQNSLLVGFDPVAIDALGWQIIEAKRQEKGLPTLKAAGREPSYIATAADEQHRLGCNDLSKTNIIRV